MNWNRVRYAVVALAALVMLGGFAIDNGLLPDNLPIVDTITVDADGDYALIVVDESNRDSATSEQWAAINSTKIIKWCNDNGVEFRRFDVRDDWSKVEPVWSKMREHIEDPIPELLILSDKKLTIQDVPISANAVIDAIKGVVQ